MKNNTQHHEAYFQSHDQNRLYYQKWTPVSSGKKPVLIFVHGLNEHSGRYQNPVDFFLKKGFSIYLFDQRGHGRSDGLRSYVQDFNHFMRDLDEFVAYVSSKELGKPLFLIGHSMGGQVVLNYISVYKHHLSGAIVSSPNVRVAMKIPPLKKTAAQALGKVFPKLTLANEIDPKWVCRDHQVVREYKKDTLVSKKTTLKLLLEILRNQEKIMSLAERIQLPLFMMHAGADEITSPVGTQEFFEKVPGKNKELKIYEGFYHELFNEIGKEEVFEDMERWIKKYF